MKIFKLGLLLFIVLSSTACSKPVVVEEILPLSDETILSDANAILSEFNLIHIDEFTTMIDKITPAQWDITAQTSISTDQGTIEGILTMKYAYTDKTWVLGTHMFIQTKVLLNDEVIRKDALSLIPQEANLSLSKINYTIDEVTKDTWVIKGEMAVETKRCTLNVNFDLSYRGSKWELTDSQATLISCVDPSSEPTLEEAYRQINEELYKHQDLDLDFSSINIISQSIDLNTGEATFIFDYTIEDDLSSMDIIVTVEGTRSTYGWTYLIKKQSYNTTYDYTAKYDLVWNVLKEESFYTSKEKMTLRIEGSIEVSGLIGQDDSYEIQSNTLSALILFRGEEFIVIPTFLEDNNFSSIVLNFGSSDHEMLILEYGIETYRGVVSRTSLFYGISFDKSHAKIFRTQ
jgi:hypothetical protein